MHQHVRRGVNVFEYSKGISETTSKVDFFKQS